MGTDKGLLPYQGTSLVQHAFGNLTSLRIEVFVSINESQQETYTKLFQSNQLIVDHPVSAGPLRGLLSAHVTFPEMDIFVLATDLPDMQPSTLEKLLQVYKAETPSYDFFAYRNEEYWEPLCGIYTSKGLKKIQNELAEGKLQSYSFQQLLSRFKTKALEITISEKSSFRNFNSQGE